MPVASDASDAGLALRMIDDLFSGLQLQAVKEALVLIQLNGMPYMIKGYC